METLKKKFILAPSLYASKLLSLDPPCKKRQIYLLNKFAFGKKGVPLVCSIGFLSIKFILGALNSDFKGNGS